MVKSDYIEFEGKSYPLVTITVFKGTENEAQEPVSNETLSNIIEEAVESGDYERVRRIDERISYFAPDDIFINQDEEALVGFIESIY